MLLGAMVVQGMIGYTQYFTHLPSLLVGIHVVGATVGRLDRAVVPPRALGPSARDGRRDSPAAGPVTAGPARPRAG